MATGSPTAAGTAAFSTARLLVEAGPTRLRLSVVDPSGALLDRELAPLQDAEPAAALEHGLERLRQRAPALPPVTPLLPSLPAATASLTEALAHLTGGQLHTVDAQLCAVWGEATRGAGGGAAEQLHLGFGTLTSGLIRRGRPYAGARGRGCAPAHICVDPAGPPCPCGGRGCLAAFTDLPALLRSSDEHGLPTDAAGSLEDLITRAAKGCTLSSRVLDRAAEALGVAVGGLLNVLDLLDVVIHTPAPEVWPLIQPTVQASVARHSFAAIRSGVRWHLSSLGDEAAVRGAATLPLPPPAPAPAPAPESAARP